MNCNKVRRSLSAFLDNEMERGERAGISRHLASCRECGGDLQELRSLRAIVRELPPVVSPARLKTELQVIASRQSVHRNWRDRAALTLHNFMRPLAVPAAGGLLCSLLLFAVLGDSLSYRQDLRNDSPLTLFTQVTMEDPSPFASNGSDVMVELTIDAHGNVADYFIPKGSLSREEMKQMGNLILFTSFNPATAYGLPTASKVVVSVHRINVRG